MAGRVVVSPGKKELIVYETTNGKLPYEKWFDGLRDQLAKDTILAKLKRLELYGHIADGEWVGGGVYELKVHRGPGYRVYFAEKGDSVIVLLCGGDKGSQDREIQKAQEYWREYKIKP